MIVVAMGRISANRPLGRVSRVIVLAALVWLAIRPADLAAQTPAPAPNAAQPERPTVATHAGTVATGWLEIEAGMSSIGTRMDPAAHLHQSC